MNDNKIHTVEIKSTGDKYSQAETVYAHLQQLVVQLQKNMELNSTGNNYAAYLHGQIYGIALTLRLLYPGPGNWGEKAALLIRPVLTEHRCDCQ
ncbi:hypothetical protein [Desulfallas thermosapovorans]|uniref:LAO/AO transport system kinase n=1 Tax=Desulfallas thermosapovorans DSM 6562 TaxID=1121431 RepID=A0A5S4ZXF4_9FIRM|nr:hypothetical protein [Desulfallas thermosapovorans]TYO97761.1 LAO/AO transport system kinase [Desulfallas thermosapovorans DSM 6562]